MALTLSSGEPTLHVLAVLADSKQDKCPKTASVVSRMIEAERGQRNQKVTISDSLRIISADFS